MSRGTPSPTAMPIREPLLLLLLGMLGHDGEELLVADVGAVDGAMLADAALIHGLCTNKPFVKLPEILNFFPYCSLQHASWPPTKPQQNSHSPLLLSQAPMSRPTLLQYFGQKFLPLAPLTQSLSGGRRSRLASRRQGRRKAVLDLQPRLLRQSTT
jgi:hypothetical protein